MRKWGDSLGKTGITYLDLSFNDIEDEGVLNIIRGL